MPRRKHSDDMLRYLQLLVPPKEGFTRRRPAEVGRLIRERREVHVKEESVSEILLTIMPLPRTIDVFELRGGEILFIKCVKPGDLKKACWQLDLGIVVDMKRKKARLCDRHWEVTTRMSKEDYKAIHNYDGKFTYYGWKIHGRDIFMRMRMLFEEKQRALQREMFAKIGGQYFPECVTSHMADYYCQMKNGPMIAGMQVDENQVLLEYNRCVQSICLICFRVIFDAA